TLRIELALGPRQRKHLKRFSRGAKPLPANIAVEWNPIRTRGYPHRDVPPTHQLVCLRPALGQTLCCLSVRSPCPGMASPRRYFATIHLQPVYRLQPHRSMTLARTEAIAHACSRPRFSTLRTIKSRNCARP